MNRSSVESLIWAERRKQEKKYPRFYDRRKYTQLELVRVANALYYQTIDENWPLSWNHDLYKKYMSYGRLKQLTIAGALMLAQQQSFGLSGKQKDFYNGIVDELHKLVNS